MRLCTTTSRKCLSRCGSHGFNGSIDYGRGWNLTSIPPFGSWLCSLFRLRRLLCTFFRLRCWLRSSLRFRCWLWSFLRLRRWLRSFLWFRRWLWSFLRLLCGLWLRFGSFLGRGLGGAGLSGGSRLFLTAGCQEKTEAKGS